MAAPGRAAMLDGDYPFIRSTVSELGLHDELFGRHKTMSPMTEHFWMPSAPIGTGVSSIVSTVSANPNSLHRESLAKLRRCDDQEFMQHIEAAPDVRRTGCVDQITPSVVSSTGFLPMSPLDRHAGWASTAEALERPQP